jgi:hypothetical protein
MTTLLILFSMMFLQLRLSIVFPTWDSAQAVKYLLATRRAHQ